MKKKFSAEVPLIHAVFIEFHLSETDNDCPYSPCLILNINAFSYNV